MKNDSKLEGSYSPFVLADDYKYVLVLTQTLMPMAAGSGLRLGSEAQVWSQVCELFMKSDYS